MLIALITQTLDEANVVGEIRQPCTRLILLVLLKISPYTKVKLEIRKLAGYDAERIVFRNLTNAMHTEAIQLRFWRAFHGFVHTKDEEIIQSYGLSLSDFEYIRTHIKAKDITFIKQSELQWHRDPITQRAVRHILKKLTRYVSFYSYKLRYVMEIDYSVDTVDFRADMIAHAILAIYHYESYKPLAYLVNVAGKSIANYWRDQCDVWNAQKRTGSGREVIDTGRVRKDGSKILDYSNHCIRSPLFLKGEDGDEFENPALGERCVRIENELEVKDFIEFIGTNYPNMQKYLKIIVLDHDDEECSAALRDKLRPTVRPGKDREDDFEERYQRTVEKIVGVTDQERLHVMRAFRKHFGVRGKSIQRTISALRGSIKEKHKEEVSRRKAVNRAK